MVRIRKKTTGFVGIQFDTDLLARLDTEVAKTTLNRSQIIRLAVIKYLDESGGASYEVRPR